MKLPNYRFRTVNVAGLSELDIVFENRFLCGPIVQELSNDLINFVPGIISGKPTFVPLDAVVVPSGYYSLSLSMARFHQPGLDQRVDFTGIECPPGSYKWLRNGSDCYSLLFYERITE